MVLKKHLLDKLTDHSRSHLGRLWLPFPQLNVAVGWGWGEGPRIHVCWVAKSNASCVAISRGIAYTRYTCGLLRNDLVLRHPTEVRWRRQITDCLFRLPATIDKQPSSNMFITILVYFQFLQDCETLLVGYLLSFLSCL